MRGVGADLPHPRWNRVKETPLQLATNFQRLVAKTEKIRWKIVTWSTKNKCENFDPLKLSSEHNEYYIGDDYDDNRGSCTYYVITDGYKETWRVKESKII